MSDELSTEVEIPGQRTGAFQDPDRFLSMAKKLVMDNYNERHDDLETPPMEPDDIYIVWFTKILGNWRAQIASTVVRGLFWIVTINGVKGEAYIEVFRKINNAKVRIRER